MKIKLENDGDGESRNENKTAAVTVDRDIIRIVCMSVFQLDYYALFNEFQSNGPTENRFLFTRRMKTMVIRLCHYAHAHTHTLLEQVLIRTNPILVFLFLSVWLEYFLLVSFLAISACVPFSHPAWHEGFWCSFAVTNSYFIVFIALNTFCSA